jgi:hypothetical protein
MDIYIKNIQGFQGEHRFTIGKGVTTITARFNGTGKTTFFDCLRALTVPQSLSKEDLEFLVTFEHRIGQFEITVGGDSYGFLCDRTSLMFTRQLEGDTEERSSEPFPEAAKAVGVYVHDKTAINICDRFSNLFSSSHGAFNNTLLESLMKDMELEEFLLDVINEVQYLNEMLNMSRTDLHKAEAQLSVLQQYTKVGAFYEILEDVSLVDQYECIRDIYYTLHSVNLEASPVVFNGLPHFTDVLQGLQEISVVGSHVHAGTVLETLCEVADLINYITVSRPIQDDTILVTDLLENLECLVSTEPISPTVFSVVDAMESLGEMEIISEAIEDLPVELFLTITKTLVDIVNLNYEIEGIVSERAKREKLLVDFIYECPLRGRVYIIEGECISA